MKNEMAKFMSDPAIPIKLIAMVIWKMRGKLDNLEIELTPADFQSFNTSMSMQGVSAIVQCVGRGKSMVLRLADESGLKEILAAEADDDASMGEIQTARALAPDVAHNLVHHASMLDKDDDVGKLMLRAANVLTILVPPVRPAKLDA